MLALRVLKPSYFETLSAHNGRDSRTTRRITARVRTDCHFHGSAVRTLYRDGPQTPGQGPGGAPQSDGRRSGKGAGRYCRSGGADCGIRAASAGGSGGTVQTSGDTTYEGAAGTG